MSKFNKLASKKRCIEIRKKILDISRVNSALHLGGSFSSVELIESIFFYFKKKNDTFILSKGHSGILLYCVMNMIGIISEKELFLYCKKKGKLGVHPDYKNFGISASTGSLGHGPALAAGMSIGGKKKENIYVLVSDGELQEGSVWEALLFISSNNLNNIVIIVDNNNLQSSTFTNHTHSTLYPIEEKFKAFGWECYSCDGNNSKEIYKKLSIKKKKPFALIAKTTKGYPISFMMNVPKWHYRSPNLEEYNLALKELSL